jgi:CheY-like chemotaxis protein
VAAALLELRGHEVRIANNGREAIERFESEPFDVVLMDVEMPVMDGIEAAIRIRALEQTSGGRIPIIAMTAHVLADVQERCRAAGMDDYLAKPIQPADLYARLDALAAKASHAEC